MHYGWWYGDKTSGLSHPRSADQSVGRSPGFSRDQRLVHSVADALLGDPAVTSGHIDLDVQNGVAILEGQVDTEVTRSAAVARAWSVAGVTDVCNALSVEERRRIGRGDR